MGILTVRRVALVLAALVFIGIAIGSLVAPDAMAEGLGYRLDNVDARNEFRAIYVGLWLAHAVILLAAAYLIHELILGDIGALLIAGQVVGRLISVIADGALPTVALLPAAIAEVVGAVGIMAMRPRRASTA